MKNQTIGWIVAFTAILFCAAGSTAHAQPNAASAASAVAAGANGPDWGDHDEDDDDAPKRPHAGTSHRGRSHHGDDSIVNLGHDSMLASGQRADSVVSILGSSTSEGEARDVVSVLGDTRVTGEVHDNAVAVFGDNYINAKVDGDVVAVFGDLELGPNAEIGGDAVVVGGELRRDPSAIIHGDTNSVSFGHLGGTRGLRAWISHCLLLGRPLAFAPGLTWAWTLALVLLAVYIGLASLFRPGVIRCVETLETQPGHTVLAALLAMLLTPVLVVLLCVTVIGIAAVPFVVIGLMCAALFGKAVILAWLGRRLIGPHRQGQFAHPAFAVLVGGILATLLYVVPVLGFLVYKILGILGFGAVVYTLILAIRARQADKVSAADQTTPPPSTAASTPPPEGAAPSPTAFPPATAALPHAGFWVRMGALLLDLVLVGFVTSVLHSVFHMHLVLLAAYGAVMWKMRGTTIGGLVFDLRVVRVDGRPVDWETALVRALGCFLSLAVAGLGFFWIAFDDAKQAWHDKIAGTVVVRAPKGTP